MDDGTGVGARPETLRLVPGKITQRNAYFAP